MLSNLLVVLPIFALILAGWIARRSNALGPHATREVNRLVVYLALPALLFDIMAKADWAEIWQPGFILAFAFILAGPSMAGSSEKDLPGVGTFAYSGSPLAGPAAQPVLVAAK